MLEHEAPENRDADLDEIGGGIVGLDQLIDAVGEELERSLRERIYEQALLRSEQRVDGSRAGSGCFGHGTDRERPAPPSATSRSAAARRAARVSSSWTLGRPTLTS